MKVAIFSTKYFDRQYLTAANQTPQHELTFFEAKLTPETASLAKDFPAICCFVNDQLDAKVLAILAEGKTQFIALRSAGYNHVDLTAAKQLGLTVARVPAYSPYAVAEFTLGLILALNRKIHKAYEHVREHDFSLQGLLGFDLHSKTVGIIGTGKIGTIFAKMMHGMSCRVIAYDLVPNEECQQLGVQYVTLDQLYTESDIISLHCPLTPETYHLINHDSIEKMKPNVMLVNTSRGKVIDTRAIIAALKARKIAYLGLDVYEEEEGLFFENLSDQIIQDDVFARLQTFPNVIITAHQAFFTVEALTNIAAVTLANLTAFATKQGEIYLVSA